VEPAAIHHEIFNVSAVPAARSRNDGRVMRVAMREAGVIADGTARQKRARFVAQ